MDCEIFIWCDWFRARTQNSEKLRANSGNFREKSVFLRTLGKTIYSAKVFDTTGYRVTAALL